MKPEEVDGAQQRRSRGARRRRLHSYARTDVWQRPTTLGCLFLSPQVEGELRRTADALAAAEAEKEALEAALREHRSRGDGAVSAADALRAQLAEKRKEIDLRERRLAVSCVVEGWLA